MAIICKNFYSETGTHIIETVYVKPGDYMLLVDGAFYSKHKSREDALKAMARTAEWFSWSELEA